jgi:hypothetical protein
MDVNQLVAATFQLFHRLLVIVQAFDMSESMTTSGTELVFQGIENVLIKELCWLDIQ